MTRSNVLSNAYLGPVFGPQVMAAREAVGRHFLTLDSPILTSVCLTCGSVVLSESRSARDLNATHLDLTCCGDPFNTVVLRSAPRAVDHD